MNVAPVLAEKGYAKLQPSLQSIFPEIRLLIRLRHGALKLLSMRIPSLPIHDSYENEVFGAFAGLRPSGKGDGRVAREDVQIGVEGASSCIIMGLVELALRLDVERHLRQSELGLNRSKPSVVRPHF